MIGVELAERVEGLVKDAVAKGAKLAAGGQREGSIMAATVLDFVTPQMRIYSEESFGPVASVVRVNTVEDAIRIANDTEYGLSSAVFGRDVNRALNVARQIESGICHINGPTVQDEAQTAVRRHESQRLWPLQRSCRHQRIHRAALDHDRDRTASLSVLTRREAAATIGSWRTRHEYPARPPSA